MPSHALTPLPSLMPSTTPTDVVAVNGDDVGVAGGAAQAPETRATASASHPRTHEGWRRTQASAMDEDAGADAVRTSIEARGSSSSQHGTPRK